MARSNSCILKNKPISVEDAIALRNTSRREHKEAPVFLCIECGEPVVPHKSSSYGAAHFEHRSQNPECILSAPVKRFSRFLNRPIP